MHLALEAIGLGRGDEVITTPYTFATAAEVVRYFDAKPVFVDICPADLNLNPDLIEAAITRHTKAIIPVHMACLPADLDAIYAIAARHNLTVIEDAAHAFPAKYKDLFIGQDLDSRVTFHVSRFACFSFYATTVDAPLALSLAEISNTAEIGDDGSAGAGSNPDNNTASVHTPIKRYIYYVPLIVSN